MQTRKSASNRASHAGNDRAHVVARRIASAPSQSAPQPITERDSQPVLVSLRLPAFIDKTLECIVAESLHNGQKVTKAALVAEALEEYFRRKAKIAPPPPVPWRDRFRAAAGTAHDI
jgi:hypothetical protein